jgi:hypothetical protein
MVLGFLPLKLFFEEQKKGFEILADQKLNYACKLYSLIEYIPNLKGFEMIVIKINSFFFFQI